MNALALIVGYLFPKHAPFIVHFIMGRANKDQAVNGVRCPGSASNQRADESNY